MSDNRENQQIQPQEPPHVFEPPVQAEPVFEQPEIGTQPEITAQPVPVAPAAPVTPTEPPVFPAPVTNAPISQPVPPAPPVDNQFQQRQQASLNSWQSYSTSSAPADTWLNRFDAALNEYYSITPAPSAPAFTPPPRKRSPLIPVLVSICSFLFVTVLVTCCLLFAGLPSNQIIDDPEQPNITLPGAANRPNLDISETPVTDSPGINALTGEMSVKQIFKKVSNSVVGVISKSITQADQPGTGSGIIMTEDGYIITNAHVIENSNIITVVLTDGTEHAAQVIGFDSWSDLAVLKIDKTGLEAAEFGNSQNVEVGDLVVAIGNPSGMQLQNTLTVGYISAVNRVINDGARNMTTMQTDAAINPGNSGGPLVNAYGQVIGINSRKLGISYYEGLGFAIPMDNAKPIIDELIQTGYIKGRPSIGVTGQPLSQSTAIMLGVPQGIYVETVDPSSDAATKGLRRGDIIFKANGEEVTTLPELNEIKDQFKAGDKLVLTIYRNGQNVDIEVVLMDANVPQQSTPVTPVP